MDPPRRLRARRFGWEDVYHCHILSHEEMDMMRPVSVAVPPVKPDALAFDPLTGTLTWNGNSIAETAYVVQKSTDGGATWVDLTTIQFPLDQPNTTGPSSYVDPTWVSGDRFRVVAENTVGFGGSFPSVTVKSISNVLTRETARTVDA